MRSLSVPEITATEGFLTGGVYFEYIHSTVNNPDPITTISGWAFAGTNTRNSAKYLVFENSDGEKSYFPMENDRIDRGTAFVAVFNDRNARYGGFSTRLRLGGLLEDGVYAIGVVIHSDGTFYEQLSHDLFKLESGALTLITNP